MPKYKIEILVGLSDPHMENGNHGSGLGDSRLESQDLVALESFELGSCGLMVFLSFFSFFP